MKHLVIAEKPSVARDIARVLGCGKKNNSYMEGKDYVVTWALGHLVTLADPEEYGEQYKTWRLGHSPHASRPLETGRDQADFKTVPRRQGTDLPERYFRYHHRNRCRT